MGYSLFELLILQFGDFICYQTRKDGACSSNYLFLLFDIERRSHLIHDAGKVWLEGSDCLADGIDVPYEDSGIPIVIASGKVLLGCLQVWLFLESLNLVDFIYECWLC